MRWLRCVNLAGGASYGTWGAFVPVVLIWHGFDAPLVALTSSLGAVVFWFALPVWGHFSDKMVGTRWAIQLAALLAALFLIPFCFSLPIWVIVLACLAGGATGGALGGLMDAQTISVLADPRRDYGRLRMLGSLGAGVFAICFGLIYDRTGYGATPVAGIVALLAIAFFAFKMPLGKAGLELRDRGTGGAGGVKPGPAVRYGRFGSLSEALGGRPRLLVILAGCLGIFIGLMGAGTFVSLRLQSLGGGPSTIGFANGLGSSAEVPGLIMASWLVVRYGVRPVLGVSSLGLAVVFASWAVLTDPIVITATKMLIGLCFAGVTVSFVITMATILPQHLVSTGQTLYQSVGFGAAAILSNFVGAFLYELGGAEIVFLFLAAATAIGGVIAVLAVPGHGRVRLVRDPPAVDSGAGEPEPSITS
jgi:MFS transporter, PPP family, 3-phenylpropionic acid transporter